MSAIKQEKVEDALCSLLQSTEIADTAKSLPKLPVPKLKETLRKLLESTKPFVTDECYTEMIRNCSIFAQEGGTGEKLQSLLEEKAAKTYYYLADWSMTYKYLQNRVPIPGRQSPMLYFPTIPFDSQTDWLKYSSKLIYAVMMYVKRLDENALPSEYYREKRLDMQQYGKVFGTCRIPRHKEDDLLGRMENIKHITVIYQNAFFEVPVYDREKSNELLNIPTIFSMLTKIIEDKSINVRQSAPVGILTTQRRDIFAYTYENLYQDSCNRSSLESIQSSLFIVCLDKPTTAPLMMANSESDYILAAHQLIYGGGSMENSANRWFDKTLQFIINENGINGITYEHTVSEGQPISNIGNFILDQLNQLDCDENETDAADLYDYRVLQFQVSEDVERDIKIAASRIDHFASDLDIDVIHFTDYGKGFIKSKQLSPDSYIQMAFQLTFYKLYNKPTPIYETVSLRKFLHGRTEGVRCCSEESIKFVRAMCISKACNTKAERMNRLKLAVNDHQKATAAGMNGLGIEKHLTALKLIAKENGIPMPDLFTSEGFLKGGGFKMDGSQIASSHETFMAVGPMIENRFSFCYNPRENDIFFTVSIMKSFALDYHTKDVRKYLLESLKDMQIVLNNQSLGAANK